VAELTIFFDGGCPLCAAEIGHLERLDGAKKMAFEDIYAPLFSERFPHIDVKKADLVLHGQWADGSIIYGLDVTYHSCFFARYRHRISALVTGKPRCERCDVNEPSK